MLPMASQRYPESRQTAVKRVSPSWHSVKQTLSTNEVARNLPWHGQQRQVFWSSFLRARLDSVRSMRQAQCCDAARHGRNHGANIFARCSTKLIGECTQHTLGTRKAQHPWQYVREQCRFRHCPTHQVVSQDIKPGLSIGPVKPISSAWAPD